MKKKVFYFGMLLVAALVFTGCPDKKNESVVGIWKCNDLKVVEYIVNGRPATDAQKKQFENTLKSSSTSPLNSIWEFKDDGTLYINGQYDGTYYQDKKKVTLIENKEVFYGTLNSDYDQLQMNVTGTNFTVGIILTRQNSKGSNKKAMPASMQEQSIQDSLQTFKEFIDKAR